MLCVKIPCKIRSKSIRNNIKQNIGYYYNKYKFLTNILFHHLLCSMDPFHSVETTCRYVLSSSTLKCLLHLCANVPLEKRQQRVKKKKKTKTHA